MGDGTVTFRIQVSGTHTGRPFGLRGLSQIPAAGTRVSLPVETMQCKIHDMVIHQLGADPLPDPTMGFPTGLYLQVGGSLDEYHECIDAGLQ